MKNTIFIGHATPDDNTFAVWLATKLELCGYKVWIDVNNLSPSVDFWNTIDNTLRTETIKYIFVASKSSCATNRDGVQKELAVADRMRKEYPNFIIPVRIDDIDYSKLPVEIIRLNAIDFSVDWRTGLDELLTYLINENVPKNNTEKESSAFLNRWHNTTINSQLQIVDQVSEYCSNLFPIELPKYVFLYHDEPNLESILAERHIPYKKNNSVIMTFVCNKCVSEWLKRDINLLPLDTLDAIKNYSKPMTFLGVSFDNISRDIISLVNWSIGEFFFLNGLRKFNPDSGKKSRNVYYFKYGEKYKRTNAKRPKNLSGRYKGKHWHFGVNGSYVQYPTPGVLINWHLVFSDSNYKMLSTSSQISARRSKGKHFYNKEWKELLLTAMEYCSKGSDYGCYMSCCEDSAFYIKSKPMRYISEKGYIEPDKYLDMFEEYDDE